LFSFIFDFRKMKKLSHPGGYYVERSDLVPVVRSFNTSRELGLERVSKTFGYCHGLCTGHDHSRE
jgi:hypothetical protein